MTPEAQGAQTHNAHCRDEGQDEPSRQSRELPALLPFPCPGACFMAIPIPFAPSAPRRMPDIVILDALHGIVLRGDRPDYRDGMGASPPLISLSGVQEFLIFRLLSGICLYNSPLGPDSSAPFSGGHKYEESFSRRPDPGRWLHVHRGKSAPQQPGGAGGLAGRGPLFHPGRRCRSRLAAQLHAPPPRSRRSRGLVGALQPPVPSLAVLAEQELHLHRGRPGHRGREAQSERRGAEVLPRAGAVEPGQQPPGDAGQ